MSQIVTAKTLYDRDFNLWLEDTLSKLRLRDANHLDWEHLIEEIESLGKSQKRELRSRLDILLSHLLKRIYVNAKDDYRGWELTIAEQRRQLQLLLEDSPSLNQYFSDRFADSWQYALKQVRKDYPDGEFPAAWPFSRDPERLLSTEFWQE